MIDLSSADELRLAERLITYDSSHPEGIRACAGCLEGWLEARSIPCEQLEVDGLPILSATVGEGPVTIVLHTHIDVVPGNAEQFVPRIEDGFLWGRGAYDMKGAAAAMFCVLADVAANAQDLGVAVRLLVVPDEESDQEKDEFGTEVLVKAGHAGDFVICGEPTDMHIGIQAKGVLDVRIDVDGRSAHGATPWLGVNAIVRAMDVFDTLHTLPFATESSPFFDRPSINLGRISGGDRLNQVPDHCHMEIDIRFLPEQPLDRIRTELQSLPGCHVHEMKWRPPAMVSTDNPFLSLLRSSTRKHAGAEISYVGRDGTNDGVHFLKRGIPSVEFGPIGAGHHGPDECVDIASLRTYRKSLLLFLSGVAARRAELSGLSVPTHPGA